MIIQPALPSSPRRQTKPALGRRGGHPPERRFGECWDIVASESTRVGAYKLGTGGPSNDRTLGGAHNDDNWDAHTDIVKNHSKHAGDTDKPVAALLKDLKRRGLLDSTIVVWGGEFGRQPTAEYAKGTGRDHNSYGFTMWMSGGGIKGGVSVGKTDELGNNAVEDRFHVKHLHATILHQMGLDPNRLSYFYGGLNQKLVGVEGAEPIAKII